MIRIDYTGRVLRMMGSIRGAILVILCLYSVCLYAAANDVEQVFENSTEGSEKASEKKVEEVAEQAAEKAVKKTAEKAVEKVVTGVVEEAKKKAAEQESTQQEITATRPEVRHGPTKVYFRIFVIDIDAIDDANQNFTANVYLLLRWKDQRLASPDGAVRQIHLDKVWNPQVLLANRQGLVSRSLPEIVQVDPDGTVYYRQRYTGKLSQQLNLKAFPLDAHVFTIQFASAAYNADELEFVADVRDDNQELKASTMSDQLSLPDWKVLGYDVISAPYHPVKEVRAAGFSFQFEAERYVEYYIWQILLPLTMVVVMSWAGFWIQRGQVGVRIGVATSSILTLIAHRFVLASLLPRLPYMTHLDYFTVGCTLLVFFALIGVVLTSYLASINRDMFAKYIDLWARFIFPLSFAILLIWFVNG